MSIYLSSPNPVIANSNQIKKGTIVTNSTDAIPILVKVSSEKDHADRFMQGEIYARRLSWFRKLEGDDQRGDELEAAIVYPRENIRIVLEPINIETGEAHEVIIPPEDIATNPVLTLDHFNNLHVFCMYATGIKNPKTVSESNIPNKLWLPTFLEEFGEHVVLIFNVTEFLQRIQESALDQNLALWGQAVKYYNPESGSPELSPGMWVVFSKSQKFAHQSEYRLVFDTGTAGDDPLTLNIGSIDDIAMRFNADNLPIQFSA